MVCENASISGVISNILSPVGCSFVIRDLSDYPAGKQLVAASEEDEFTVSFNEIAAIVALNGEIALGWSEEGSGATGPWEFNPKDRQKRRKWHSDDRYRIVVLERDSARAKRASMVIQNALSIQSAVGKVMKTHETVGKMQKLLQLKRESVDQESVDLQGTKSMPVGKIPTLIQKRREHVQLESRPSTASGERLSPPNSPRSTTS
eukprot:gnl/TRDRNA2_/TRDRNA2_158161_c1_seq1.p1 gnl/TRDRNA2_/TRDRNA2_158161_c1~~gnl/TRDRNA2_/TRDRNA2_158161_c1_seq1.p1  ORF type:complete len:218 (-),score=31.40 gnl/TRDRNA2_/TRDRNA2_158161_c1_seq1:84-698(-)